MDMSVKQVIVMRKDLNMRRGKEISQGAHASSMWLVNRVSNTQQAVVSTGMLVSIGMKILMLLIDFLNYFLKRQQKATTFSDEELEWMIGRFTKVTVRVNSEEELLKVYNDAQKAGLMTHLVTDSGKTEFGGQPTNTCLCIGPHKAEQIDKITGNLEIY